MTRLIGWLLVSGIVLGACSKGNFSQDASRDSKDVFRYPIPTNPTTLDPGKVQDGDTIDLLQQTYEGLVGWDQESKVSPRLATKWEVSPDGKTYTFHLRTDAKFFSGRPVTAQDFKWCIERNCDPKLAFTTVADYLSDIVGVMDKHNGKRKDIPGIVVVDDHTLKIKIDKPRPYFLGKLTYPVSFVFDKNALKNPLTEITDPSEMIGTGPFIVSSVHNDQVVILKANPNYYGGSPKIAGIERPIVTDAATRLEMYKSGQVDLVQLQRQDALSLKNDPQYKSQLHFFERPCVWYVGLNTRLTPAFGDRRVRRAIAMAINKDNIIDVVLDKMNPKADGILPPKVFGHRDKVDGIGYDPKAAQLLLAQAGYPGGKGFPQVTMFYRESYPDIRIVANAVGQDLKSNLGIDVAFKSLEWGHYLDLDNKNKLPLFHMRWGADYLDAQNFLSTLLASYGPENHTQYSNPQFDALCSQADSSMDPALRLKLYAQAEDIALQDAAFIPIYFQNDAELISPRVKDIRESVFGHLPHTKLELQ
jgi:oligopeptide transport system substrate-binding protein